MTLYSEICVVKELLPNYNPEVHVPFARNGIWGGMCLGVIWDEADPDILLKTEDHHADCHDPREFRVGTIVVYSVDNDRFQIVQVHRCRDAMKILRARRRCEYRTR